MLAYVRLALRLRIHTHAFVFRHCCHLIEGHEAGAAIVRHLDDVHRVPVEWRGIRVRCSAMLAQHQFPYKGERTRIATEIRCRAQQCPRPFLERRILLFALTHMFVGETPQPVQACAVGALLQHTLTSLECGPEHRLRSRVVDLAVRQHFTLIFETAPAHIAAVSAILPARRRCAGRHIVVGRQMLADYVAAKRRPRGVAAPAVAALQLFTTRFQQLQMNSDNVIFQVALAPAGVVAVEAHEPVLVRSAGLR